MSSIFIYHVVTRRWGEEKWIINSKHYGGNWSWHDRLNIPEHLAEIEENYGNLLRLTDVLSEIWVWLLPNRCLRYTDSLDPSTHLVALVHKNDIFSFIWISHFHKCSDHKGKWNWFRPFDFIIKYCWKRREAVFYAGLIGQLFDISPLTKGAAFSGRNMCSRCNRKPSVILPWMWTQSLAPKVWHPLTGMHYVIFHKFTTKWKHQL